MSLTRKQEAFAQAVASGLNLTDSYRLAYNPSPSSLPSTVHDNAYTLSKHTGVAPRIEELRRIIQLAAEKELGWDQRILVREAKTNLDMARTGGWRGVSAANGALEIIGRATGLLSDKPREVAPVITRVVVVLDRGVDREGRAQRVVGAEYEVKSLAEPEEQAALAVETGPSVDYEKSS